VTTSRTISSSVLLRGEPSSSWRSSWSSRTTSGLISTPRQPRDARSRTAQTSDSHERSLGSRPITFTRRRVSPNVLSMKFECLMRAECSFGNTGMWSSDRGRPPGRRRPRGRASSTRQRTPSPASRPPRRRPHRHLLRCRSRSPRSPFSPDRGRASAPSEHIPTRWMRQRWRGESGNTSSTVPMSPAPP